MHYIIDTLEALIFDTTGQCDLVRRQIMSYLGPAEALRIKAALTQEWIEEQYESQPETDEIFDDFYPYEVDSE